MEIIANRVVVVVLVLITVTEVVMHVVDMWDAMVAVALVLVNVLINVVTAKVVAYPTVLVPPIQEIVSSFLFVF